MCDYDDLTREQQAEIWERWQHRVTIESLATEFNTSKEVIREIISLPRKPW